MTFYSCDIKPVTSIFTLNPDLVKMYLHTENEVPNCYSSNIIG